MKYPTSPKEPAYQPETPNHTRTVVKTVHLISSQKRPRGLFFESIVDSAKKRVDLCLTDPREYSIMEATKQSHFEGETA
jgi:hypothetical protein